MIGSSLSHYRIQSEIGRGGMGIVFKAEDTKLDRTVAIKVLPAAALNSEDDRARFYREAKAAAQLHHPHIASVFEIDEASPEGVLHDGVRPFIAMEFIDGEPLSEHIKRGPVKLDEAVRIASQIASALDAAHDKDIVHRDIKAQNVMLTSKGDAKVLDFGLALTAASTKLTRMGSTLGTVAYMSPEQARGEEVDYRTDLYSLGTVLYEMVAGRLPYAGEYEQAVVYSILNADPEPLTAVRTGVPMELERITGKLLSKDRSLRYQSAADVIADLRALDMAKDGTMRRSVASMSAAPTFNEDPTRSVHPRPWMWVSAAALILVLLTGAWWIGTMRPEPARPYRVVPVHLPERSLFVFPIASPDGRFWSMSTSAPGAITENLLWDLQRNETRSIPGSQNFFNGQFSPDGSWIAFGDNQRVIRAQIPSGSALHVDSAASFTWLDNDRMLVGGGRSLDLAILSLVSGRRTALEVSPPDTNYVLFEDFSRLQEGNAVLMTAQRRDLSKDIIVVDAASETSRVLVRGACCARQFDSRSLIYLTGNGISDFNPVGQIVAQRFDAHDLEVRGVPVNLSSDPVVQYRIGVSAADLFFLLPEQTIIGSERSISWIDPDTDSVDRIDIGMGNYGRMSLSPDASRLAVEKAITGGPDEGSNIFIIDLRSGTERRITFETDRNRAPAWGRDGRIFYASGPFGAPRIYARNADGSGREELIIEDGDFPTLSRDGEWIAYRTSTSGGDLYATNLRTGSQTAIDTTAFTTSDPALSPNGRFIAYSQSEATIGQRVPDDQRIFVRSFPDGSIFRTRVVDEFADDPVWSSDGKWLYYRGQTALKRVAVDTEETFRVLSTPESVVNVVFQYRTIAHPTEGLLMISHPGQQLVNRPERVMEVTFNFSTYLDELFGDN